MYTLERDHEGDVIFERRDLEADALIRFAGSAADELLREIESFWSLAPASRSAASFTVAAISSTAHTARARARSSARRSASHRA